jgi:hypothetical protein
MLNPAINQPSSIKELIQSLIPIDKEIILGIVISEDDEPLEIQAVNDPKLILNENTAVIPWHLTDYRTWMSFDKPEIKQKIDIYDRAELEAEGMPLPEAVWAGDEPHEIRPDDTPADIEKTTDITFQKKWYENTLELMDEDKEIPDEVELPAFHEVTIYNSLRKDDMLYILSFNHGKKYFVLDRVMDTPIRRRRDEEIGDNVKYKRRRIP